MWSDDRSLDVTWCMNSSRLRQWIPCIPFWMERKLLCLLSRQHLKRRENVCKRKKQEQCVKIGTRKHISWNLTLSMTCTTPSPSIIDSDRPKVKAIELPVRTPPELPVRKHVKKTRGNLNCFERLMSTQNPCLQPQESRKEIIVRLNYNSIDRLPFKTYWLSSWIDALPKTYWSPPLLRSVRLQWCFSRASIHDDNLDIPNESMLINV